MNSTVTDLISMFAWSYLAYKLWLINQQTMAPFACLKNSLFGFFFQPEQYFSFTTIQPEQCFSASFSQISDQQTGQYFSLTPNQATVLSAMTYKPNQPERIGRRSNVVPLHAWLGQFTRKAFKPTSLRHARAGVRQRYILATSVSCMLGEKRKINVCTMCLLLRFCIPFRSIEKRI